MSFSLEVLQYTLLSVKPTKLDCYTSMGILLTAAQSRLLRKLTTVSDFMPCCQLNASQRSAHNHRRCLLQHSGVQASLVWRVYWPTS